MNSASTWSPATVSGVLAEKGGSTIFFGRHSIFAIFEPSGNGLPLPGTPLLYASIIMRFARIILMTFWASVRLGPTACQSSYPLNSANASPPGAFKAYLSCLSCAAMVHPPMMASAPVIATLTAILVPFIALFPLWLAVRPRPSNASHAPTRTRELILLNLRHFPDYGDAFGVSNCVDPTTLNDLTDSTGGLLGLFQSLTSFEAISPVINHVT